MTADLLAQLDALRDEVKSGATSVGMLLDTLDPAEAALLRKCAITHQFTPEILRVLDPTLTEQEAEAQYDEISGLSMVIRTPDGLGLHDRAREELFPSWLEPEHHDELVALSCRLADHFAALMKIDSAHLQNYRRRYVYHLIGADQRAGYKAFRETYDEYRQHLLYTFCVNLVRLVHEYDLILAPDLKRDLRYREGKLTLERDPDGALKLLKPLADDPETPPWLRIKVMNRIGMAWCKLRRLKKAAKVLSAAAKLAEEHGAVRDWARVLLNLAQVHSDSRDLDRAETLLNHSIELARQAKDDGGVANALNSLGSVHHRAGDQARAIHQYEESLKYISEGDFHRAKVYNNIANCYLELRDWDQCHSYLHLSLEMKKSGRDIGGQANTYANLAKMYIARGDRTHAAESAQQACALFTEVSNWYEVGQTKCTLARIDEKGPQAEAAMKEAIDAFARAKAKRERGETEQELKRMRGEKQSRWSPKVIASLITTAIVLAGLVKACFRRSAEP
jgi:tetratricopeptide (TPR) repeat protein